MMVAFLNALLWSKETITQATPDNEVKPEPHHKGAKMHLNRAGPLRQ
ncbi:hypothetical protein [Erwinia tasmaniensis]